MKNRCVVNLLQEKINVLLEMYKHDDINKKVLIREIKTNLEKLQNKLTSEDAKIRVQNNLNYYDYLDTNNYLLKFNCPKLFKILKQELNEKTPKNKKYQIKSLEYKNNTKLDILSNSSMMNELNNIKSRNVFDDLEEIVEKVIGEDEIFIRYIGDYNDDFFKLELNATNKAKSSRTIHTDRDYFIFYYGGKEHNTTQNTLNLLFSYAEEYGVNFTKEEFDKKGKQYIKKK